MILWFLIGFSFVSSPPPFLLPSTIPPTFPYLNQTFLVIPSYFSPSFLSFLLSPDSNDIYFLNARIAFLGTAAEAVNPAEIDSPALQPLDQDDYNEGGVMDFTLT